MRNVFGRHLFAAMLVGSALIMTAADASAFSFGKTFSKIGGAITGAAKSAISYTQDEFNSVAKSATSAWNSVQTEVVNDYKIALSTLGAGLDYFYDDMARIFRRSANSFYYKQKPFIQTLNNRALNLSDAANAAIKRIVQEVGKNPGIFNESIYNDMKLVGSELGFIRGSANSLNALTMDSTNYLRMFAAAPGLTTLAQSTVIGVATDYLQNPVVNSSWGIAFSADASLVIGVNSSFAMAMNIVPERDGTYKAAFISSIGASIGAQEGAGVQVAIFWQPGNVDNAVQPAWGFGFGGDIEDVGIGFSFGIPSIPTDPTQWQQWLSSLYSIVPGIAVGVPMTPPVSVPPILPVTFTADVNVSRSKGYIITPKPGIKTIGGAPQNDWNPSYVSNMQSLAAAAGQNWTPLPGFTKCAELGSYCNVPAGGSVAIGSDGFYVIKVVPQASSIYCSLGTLVPVSDPSNPIFNQTLNPTGDPSFILPQPLTGLTYFTKTPILMVGGPILLGPPPLPTPGFPPANSNLNPPAAEVAAFNEWQAALAKSLGGYTPPPPRQFHSGASPQACYVSNAALPDFALKDWTKCADANGSCKYTGKTTLLAIGAEGVYRVVPGRLASGAATYTATCSTDGLAAIGSQPGSATVGFSFVMGLGSAGANYMNVDVWPRATAPKSCFKIDLAR